MAELNGRIPRLRDAPEFPEDLRYLYEWWRELQMGADESMSGLRITWNCLDAWSRHMGVTPEPNECQALFWLDMATRNPQPEKK